MSGFTRADEATLADLAVAQAVSPWSDETLRRFGLREPIVDEDFAAFLGAALSSRGER
jgi:hypothetical protein